MHGLERTEFIAREVAVEFPDLVAFAVEFLTLQLSQHLRAVDVVEVIAERADVILFRGEDVDQPLAAPRNAAGVGKANPHGIRPPAASDRFQEEGGQRVRLDQDADAASDLGERWLLAVTPDEEISGAQVAYRWLGERQALRQHLVVVGRQRLQVRELRYLHGASSGRGSARDRSLRTHRKRAEGGRAAAKSPRGTLPF